MGWFIFALIAGAAITVQAGANSQLKQSLGEPVGALIVNYVFGLIGVVLVGMFVRVPIPATEKIAATPWWAWTGGLLGIIYGLSIVLLAKPDGCSYADRHGRYGPACFLGCGGSLRVDWL